MCFHANRSKLKWNVISFKLDAKPNANLNIIPMPKLQFPVPGCERILQLTVLTYHNDKPWEAMICLQPSILWQIPSAKTIVLWCVHPKIVRRGLFSQVLKYALRGHSKFQSVGIDGWFYWIVTPESFTGMPHDSGVVVSKIFCFFPTWANDPIWG